MSVYAAHSLKSVPKMCFSCGTKNRSWTRQWPWKEGPMFCTPKTAHAVGWIRETVTNPSLSYKNFTRYKKKQTWIRLLQILKAGGNHFLNTKKQIHKCSAESLCTLYRIDDTITTMNFDPLNVYFASSPARPTGILMTPSSTLLASSAAGCMGMWLAQWCQNSATSWLFTVTLPATCRFDDTCI